MREKAMSVSGRLWMSGILIWVVGAESQDDVAIWSHHEGVSSHRNIRESYIVGVDASVIIGTDNSLKSVPVQMEGMLAGILAVEDNLNDLVLLQYKSIDVGSVNSCVHGCSTGCESGEKGWDFRLDVGDIVEECTGSGCQG